MLHFNIMHFIVSFLSCSVYDAMAIKDTKASALQLKALNRVDTHITSFTKFTTKVAIYKLDPSGCKWEDPEFEGTLFFCQRDECPQPSHACLVLLSQQVGDNFILNLEWDTSMEQCDGNYMFFRRNSVGDTYAVWFADLADKAEFDVSTIQALNALTPAGQRTPRPGCIVHPTPKRDVVAAALSEAARMGVQSLSMSGEPSPKTPGHFGMPANGRTSFTRQRVRGMLQTLLDNDQFIDTVVRHLNDGA